MWINYSGSNFTTAQVVAIINQATGASWTNDTLQAKYRVGAIYRNGTLYFQRMA